MCIFQTHKLTFGRASIEELRQASKQRQELLLERAEYHVEASARNMTAAEIRAEVRRRFEQELDLEKRSAWYGALRELATLTDANRETHRRLLEMKQAYSPVFGEVLQMLGPRPLAPAQP